MMLSVENDTFILFIALSSIIVIEQLQPAATWENKEKQFSR